MSYKGLIECPSCKAGVSSEASQCPKCGQPVNEEIINNYLKMVEQNTAAAAAAAKESRRKKLWIGVLVLVVGICWVMIENQKRKEGDHANPKQSAAIADKEKVFNVTPDKFIFAYNNGIKTMTSKGVAPLKFEDMPEIDTPTTSTKRAFIDSTDNLAIVFSKSSKLVKTVLHTSSSNTTSEKHGHYIMLSLTACAIVLDIPQDERLANFAIEVITHKSLYPNRPNEFKYQGLKVLYATQDGIHYLAIMRDI